MGPLTRLERSARSGDLAGTEKTENFVLDPKGLADLLMQIDEGIISGKIAKEIFKEMVETKKDAQEIIEEKGLVQIKDKEMIERIIEEVLAENEDSLNKYFTGKEKVFGFFVGEVMKKSKGKANPKLVNEILRERLKR